MKEELERAIEELSIAYKALLKAEALINDYFGDDDRQYLAGWLSSDTSRALALVHSVRKELEDEGKE
jgi:hypothetical protein